MSFPLHKQFPGNDLMSGSNFAAFLSSFWTQIFSDSGLGFAVADQNSARLAQLYQDFVEAVNRTSTRTIPVWHTELVVPLRLLRSQLSSGPGSLVYGGGQVYGAQPQGGDFSVGEIFNYGDLERLSFTFYFRVDASIRRLGSVLLNRLASPSVSLMADSDFFFRDGILVLRENPFENPLIPRRPIDVKDGVPGDEEIMLWGVDAQVETYNLHTQYGFIFSNEKESDEHYRSVIDAYFGMLSRGPSRRALDTFVSAVLNLPTAIEDGEVVAAIEEFDGRAIISTDKSVYSLPALSDLRTGISVGTALRAGQPLSSAARVTDRQAEPNWWASKQALYVPGEMVMAPLRGGLGFQNKQVIVRYTGEALLDPAPTGLAEFEVLGLDADVRAFWDFVKRRSTEDSQYLGNLLWRAAGKVTGVIAPDGLPQPDFTKTVTINPMEFIFDEILGDNTVILEIDLNRVDVGGRFFHLLSRLRQAIPAHCLLLTFSTYSQEEVCAFQNDVTALALVNTSDLLAQNSAAFDPASGWSDAGATAEVISVDSSPDIVEEVFDTQTGVIEFLDTKKETSCSP